jgi:REP element-mobilizing transposase RayT
MSTPFEFHNVPLGCLITFRGHGTWLHGDKRGSVDRFHNRFGSPRLPPNESWQDYNRQELKHPPVKLGSEQRQVVEAGIRETCQIRKWDLWAINVRTNHIHAVVSASCAPELVLNAFKANATRKLREAGYWNLSSSPWAERGSKRYLWTQKDVNDAIAYVEYDQGEPLV